MITLKNVILRRGAKVLLDQASVTLNPGEKVGLVGRNGAGKSTLFALLNGSLHEDGGDFSMPPHWRMAQVAQHMPETTDSATQFVLSGDTRLSEAQAALASAEASEDGEAIGHAHALLQDAGAHDVKSRAQSLILGPTATKRSPSHTRHLNRLWSNTVCKASGGLWPMPASA